MTATTKSTKNQPATAANLLPQEICDEVLLEKYAKGNEKNIFVVRARVARALAAMEPEDKRAVWEARFLEAQEKGFVPAGRINSAAGTNLAATLTGRTVVNLNYTGGRLDHRIRRRPLRHLHRAGPVRRNHASRWRRGL